MNNYFPTEYQSFIHKSRYARWLPEKNRRETWAETVTRYFDFFEEHLLENNKFKLTKDVRKELEESILNLEVMPSMRCLMTAGEALKRENVAGYNCSYVAVDNPRSFDEILYILMNGCFHEDTLIKTLSGDKKIKDVSKDDQVLTYNIEENKYEYVSPLWVIPTPHSSEKNKLRLTFEDGSSVLCTEDHEFYTNRGWVKAKDLTDDDDIVNYMEKTIQHL
jgi:intein/homing endonuclease